MPTAPRPFAGFEFLIAWRYIRAKRAEGGVSVMTWISFLGIMLAVMALIATLAVRSGFRYEFVNTILGANPHATIIPIARQGEDGRTIRVLEDYDAIAERYAAWTGEALIALRLGGDAATPAVTPVG